jgi:hypothetical protein
MWGIRVFGRKGLGRLNPGFRPFEDMYSILYCSSYSPVKILTHLSGPDTSLHHRHHLNLSLYPISYQGGGDYRSIYDIGFKRGFMGYIGLLLNAPYKIDRMMGCVCGLVSLYGFLLLFLLINLANITR